MDVRLFVFLSIPDSWLSNSDSRSRSSYNHTYQHAYLCGMCMYIFVLFLFLFFCVYLTGGCLTLCSSSIQAALFGQQPATVRAAQWPAAEHTVILLRPRHVHVHTVDGGLWRLQLQRRLRRCAARPHRLLPHASWYTGTFVERNNVGAARRFPRHAADDVSTLMCVLVWVCDCVSPLQYK